MSTEPSQNDQPEKVTFVGPDGLRLAGDRWTPEGDVRGTAVLLHGGGQTRHSWRATAKRLAGDGWTAITYDARGHGESDWASDGNYSMSAFVGDLYTVIETLSQPPALIGASLDDFPCRRRRTQGRAVHGACRYHSAYRARR
jgi:pimeloyl-ACP methyl ester carboxylesterase